MSNFIAGVIPYVLPWLASRADSAGVPSPTFGCLKAVRTDSLVAVAGLVDFSGPRAAGSGFDRLDVDLGFANCPADPGFGFGLDLSSYEAGQQAAQSGFVAGRPRREVDYGAAEARQPARRNGR